MRHRRCGHLRVHDRRGASALLGLVGEPRTLAELCDIGIVYRPGTRHRCSVMASSSTRSSATSIDSSPPVGWCRMARGTDSSDKGLVTQNGGHE
jgi:hypothetical protein